MIQVVDRAFTILEQVAADPARVWSVSEMAALIGVQSATCFHIADSLVTLGYLERLGMRRGYRLGPAVNRLCHSSAYRPDLVEAADSLLRDFAERHRESILIAVLQGTKRYVLCQADHEHKLQVNYNLSVIEDVYHTATGRLLLASAGEAGIAEFIDRAGLPSRSSWGEVGSREQLLRELEVIRKRDGLVLESDHYLAQIAFPIFDADGSVMAALGCFVPKYRFEGAHRDAVLAELLRIAATISARLRRDANVTI